MIRMFMSSKFWIFLGVIMTIASAFMNHNVISKNNRIIKELHNESNELGWTIEGLWQGANRFEYNGNMALTMAFVVADGENINALTIDKQNMVVDFMRRILAKENQVIDDEASTVSLIELVNSMDDNRREVITRIDDLYIRKLEIEQEIDRIGYENSYIANIALFLQVIGLMLVILGKEFR